MRFMLVVALVCLWTVTARAVPPADVPFHHLRVEFATSSDWSRLELLTPDPVLSLRLMSVIDKVDAGIDKLALSQPLADAQAGKPVGIVVDYAIDPSKVSAPLRFKILRGGIGKSVVKVMHVAGGQTRELQTIEHAEVVQSNPDANPKDISIDLSALQTVSPSRGSAGVKRTGTKLVWAFYYLWYDENAWSSPQLKDRPVEKYGTATRDIIRKHIGQAKSVGIDGFLFSYWGPDSDNSLRMLLEEAKAQNFKVSIYFETMKKDGPRDRAEILSWLSHFHETFIAHPALYKLEGKPVIPFWASGWVSRTTWKGIFDELNAAGKKAVTIAMGYDASNLAVFDGVHEYSVFIFKDLAATTKTAARMVRNYSLLDPQAPKKIWVATVQPGYDDRLMPGRKGEVQERNNGAFYKSTYAAAGASDPDWIFITSWNEWYEHTHIEPSEQFGDTYLTLTKDLNRRWKGR